MARRKKHASHENHERWLVSYADFITLLFAFFVVMFASAKTDQGKAAEVAESVRNALHEGYVGAAITNLFGSSGPYKKGDFKKQPPPKPEGGGNAVLAELLPSLAVLKQELKTEIAAGKIEVALEARGLVISLREAAFFPSGQDTIEDASLPPLQKIAATVGKLPNPVRLEGHTDSVPISNSRFKSNWELSAARSIAMLELFTSRLALPVNRFAVAGYADTVPVQSNETGEGRARNRRVDIVILNQQGYAKEPQQANAPTPPKPSPAH
jgi:chemotaxis protein MotB